MERFKYPLPPKSLKKDYLFNMFGSLTNAGTSVLLLIIVSHILGAESAGIFTLGYSTGQMMQFVGTMEIHNIQVTDVERRFQFSDFHMLRLITLAIMAVVSVGFVFYRGFSGTKAIVVILLCLYMMLPAYSGVFQGNMHLNGYLYLSGISLGGEQIIGMIGFTIALLISRDLIISIIVMIAVTLLWVIFYDIPFSASLSELRPVFRKNKLKQLILNAVPLFLSSFLIQYMFNAPKYAIDKFLTDLDQSRFGYLVMPSFFINLLSLFIFRPQIVPLTEQWLQKDYKGFKKALLKSYGWIMIITLFVLIGGYFLGIPILNLLYATNLNEYRIHLMVFLIGGGFSAATTLTMIVLTIIRKQRFGLIACGITFVVSLLVPNLLVSQYGMEGAVASYLIEMVVLFIIMMLSFILCFNKTIKQNGTK